MLPYGRNIRPPVPYPMNTGVFCNRDDTVARGIAERIEQISPGACRIFDINPDSSTIALHGDRIFWSGVDLSKLRTAWVSGLPYMDPVIPPIAEDVDWSLWRYDHLVAQQRWSAMESTLQELERRGVRLINPRRAALRRYLCAQHLLSLSRNGCAIPDLLVSNDMTQVEEFCRHHEWVLWRPVTGRGAWQRFTERQRLHLVGPDKPPILLAEGQPADLLIAWVFDDEPLLCLGLERPAQREVDALGRKEDFGELARLETLETVTVLDGKSLESGLRRAAIATGWPWVQLTFTVTGGTLRVYEADPDPMFEWLPAVLKTWLIEACACKLLGHEPDLATRPAVGTRLERPALFLRRMLQIQFDMERSKYPQDGE